MPAMAGIRPVVRPDAPRSPIPGPCSCYLIPDP